MWSKSSAIEGALLIKSILMYNSSPSEFHVVCDEEAENYLRARLTLVVRPRHDVSVTFYKPTWQNMLGRIEREGTIKTDHSAGLPGLMKLFLHEIIPVEKGIYIDTDAFFISDPTLLWDVFATLKPSISVVMSNHPDQNAPEWNHASRICSCVMLLHLERLRNQRLMDSTIYRADTSHLFPPALAPEAFRAMYGLPGGDGYGRYDNVRLGDQGYWWAIVSHRPDIFEPLSYDFEVTSCLLNTYNIGLGDDDINESVELSRQTFLDGTPQEGTVILPKLLHFNCLHGTDVYMDWEGWSNPDDILTQRWGGALKYHRGYKWIWLNSGKGTLRLETASAVFADEQFAKGMNL
ncbi:Glycosyltransferase-like protein LARGE2 [Leucoagaricus sp. SymC.cos]|nr:Glycosyltransferase-like protein LARGE2 [Leucoagaricus sp. SymC.cos]